MLFASEVVETVLFIGLLAWAFRSKNPINVGALAGGCMLFGFDWLWCSRGFWNATVNPNMMMIPGLNIQGLTYPFTICFVWGIGFGFVPLLASKYYDSIRGALGRAHFPVILLLGACIDVAVEGVFVSVFHQWTYHQDARFKIFGDLWSNTWMLGGIIALAYFGLAYAERWANLPDRPGLSPFKESTWKGFFMAMAAILTPAALLGPLQLFWWSTVHPWVESGRPF